jgi:glutaconate CoA-transferase subunit B
MNAYTADEMMTVAAARRLRNGATCFVGIGLPSAACNLARLTHAPDIVLLYESGTIGTKPTVLPLSIGDGELADTAVTVIPLTEVFTHYLQRGRMDVGFLSAAQIDRFGNLNSTVIGSYDAPGVRLPGAGGAPEIASNVKELFIIMKQSPRTFVSHIDFRTTVGWLEGSTSRQRAGITGDGPAAVITDLGVLTPAEGSRELELSGIFQGVTVDEMRAACGWPLRVAGSVTTIAPPTDTELQTLRALHERTRAAHAERVRIVLPR